MSQTTPPTGATAPERVRISCPGCGRHDWVTWPAGQAVLHWTCFNCGRTSDLEAGGHH